LPVDKAWSAERRARSEDKQRKEALAVAGLKFSMQGGRVLEVETIAIREGCFFRPCEEGIL
jgi:hypothetical protein